MNRRLFVGEDLLRDLRHRLLKVLSKIVLRRRTRELLVEPRMLKLDRLRTRLQSHSLQLIGGALLLRKATDDLSRAAVKVHHFSPVNTGLWPTMWMPGMP